MDGTPRDLEPSELGPSNISWLPSCFMEKLQSVSLVSQEDNLSVRESAGSGEQDGLSSQTASQILWTTGSFSGPVPYGFYSVIPVSNFNHDHSEISSERSAMYNLSLKQINSNQKAISLPSSPNESRGQV